MEDKQHEYIVRVEWTMNTMSTCKGGMEDEQLEYMARVEWKMNSMSTWRGWNGT